MTHPRWRFARMTPAEINQDPVQGEFFSREANLPGRLVREALQNSLDAKLGGQPVTVRFVFSGNDGALPVDRAARYLQGLKEHVQAVVDAGGMVSSASSEEDEEESAAHDALACFNKPMTYLVVEDFGTRGLRGDIHANSERERGNDFWGFFRSVGISPKGENDAGSWGLGKWVFPDASIINAYLGMTQPEGEDKWLLMGMALLKTHHLDKIKYRYYGSFAAHSEKPDEDWFPLPVDSEDFVLDTAEDFNLERLEDPGLSVIVPYPRTDLVPAAIVRTVLTQYFLPIVRGDLVVEIVHPETGNRTIDSTSIMDEVQHITASNRDDESPESLHGVIELARWALEQGESAHIELPARKLAAALAKRADLDALRERYERGERLAFRLTAKVRARKNDSAIDTNFRLYLEHDDRLDKGHDYFMRGPLRIPRMDHIERHKARALVLVDDVSPLGHMLRDAEGPAHESWDPHKQRLKDNWSGGYQHVQDVRRATVQLLQRLIERPQERQLDALADLFPGDPSQIGKRTSGKPGSTVTDALPKTPPPSPSPLQIDSPAGAFELKSTNSGEVSFAGAVWNLRFAYDTVSGNPFTAFEAGLRRGFPDFSLQEGSKLAVKADGCQCEITGANALRLVALEETFRLRISGFDERDVKVEVLKEKAAEEEAI